MTSMFANVTGEPAAAALPAFYPPTVTPPDRPVPLKRAFFTFVKNPLRTLSRPVYEEPMVVFDPGRGRALTWVTRPDLVEAVLLRHFEDFEKTEVERRVLGVGLGDGVLTANGAHWRWQRRVMAPLFRHQEILGYVPDMAHAGEELVERWRRTPGRVERDIDDDMVDVTFDVIARTMLPGNTIAEGDLIKREGGIFLARSSWELAYALLRLPAWLPHPGTFAMRRAIRRLRGAVGAIIARRRAAGGSGNDLLGRLLAARDPESGEPMSDDQLVNNLLTLLEAGHETTARALTWTLYILARQPHWQDRIRAEVYEVAGHGPIGAEHVGRLATTERVVKEAMRLYPPAPVIVRTPRKPIQLDQHMVQPGAQVVIPIYAIHRHRRLWHDPDRFDPDRFLPEREKLIPRTQYMPFGAGPRICLGMSFAQVEAVVLLATFIRGARFGWDGKHVPEPVSRVTLRPKGGMPLLVTPL